MSKEVRYVFEACKIILFLSSAQLLNEKPSEVVTKHSFLLCVVQNYSSTASRPKHDPLEHLASHKK